MAAPFDLEAFAGELKQKKEQVEAYLAEYLPAKEAYPPVIHQAMHYAVENGGKRLRPILVLEGARIAGGSAESVAPVACALELIHTYSLVHDDLPAMDDDDYRRGQPTCHKVFGEANAILTGDALLTAAFGLIAANGAEEIDPAGIIRVISLVAEAAGSQGMIGGQVLDLEAEDAGIDYEDLKKLHRLKTAELFRASLLAGAILHKMPAQGLKALERYAYNFGLAFQITDDILDVKGDPSLTGKPVGSDAKNGKTTYAVLLGLKESENLARQCIEACLESLAGFGPEADFLRRLALYVMHRNS